MTADQTADAPTVLVTAVGGAEGPRAAAAALACAGADVDRATLLVDFGGRGPRPTLLASAAAHRLEERLAAHLPKARVAARGQTCHVAVTEDAEGIELASAAVAVARGDLAVLHLRPSMVQAVLAEPLGARVTGALLRADVEADRPLLALAVRDLIGSGIRVGVLKQPLSWVASRRAFFGSLPADAPGGLPPALVRRLTPAHMCYVGSDDARTDSARAAQRERQNHAGAGSR